MKITNTLKRAVALLIFILSIASFIAYKSGYFSKKPSANKTDQPIIFQNSLPVNHVDSLPPTQKDFISSSKSITIVTDSTLLKSIVPKKDKLKVDTSKIK